MSKEENAVRKNSWQHILLSWLIKCRQKYVYNKEKVIAAQGFLERNLANLSQILWNREETWFIAVVDGKKATTPLF